MEDYLFVIFGNDLRIYLLQCNIFWDVLPNFVTKEFLELMLNDGWINEKYVVFLKSSLAKIQGNDVSSGQTIVNKVAQVWLKIISYPIQIE